MNLHPHQPTIDHHTKEIHSGDMTAACPRSVLLGWLGKRDGKYPTALYKGTVAHAALAILHGPAYMWTVDGVSSSVFEAAELVDKEIASTNCEKTEACERDRFDITQELSRVLWHYSRRLSPLFLQCETLGVETPVRMDLGAMTGDDPPIAFASHVDLIIRDTDGVFGRGKNRLLIFDFKYEKEPPTRAYIARNKQMMLYATAVSFGKWMIDDKWITFKDEWPDVCYLHPPSLKPFARKVTRKEGIFLAGDERPLDRCILNWCDFQPHNATRMVEELIDHVRMLRAGFFPKIPSKVGCQLCSSAEWCQRGDYEPSRDDL